MAEIPWLPAAAKKMNPQLATFTFFCVYSPIFAAQIFRQVPTKFSKETYLYWYELMQLIRQFELKAEEKYKMAGKIRGFFHAYVGQEALAAGCMTATRQEDPFIRPTATTAGH